jgi:DinB superfamily
MTAPNELGALADRLRAAGAAIASLAPAVDAGRPWPLSDDFGTAPESHWGPPETLAHVAELLSFWSGEIERILDASSDGGPVPFGRVADNPLRLGLIERDRSLPPRELFDRIEAGVARLAGRLARLSPEEGGRRGVHPTLGETTVTGIAERFIVGHLEEHAEQLQATLGRPA